MPKLSHFSVWKQAGKAGLNSAWSEAGLQQDPGACRYLPGCAERQRRLGLEEAAQERALHPAWSSQAPKQQHGAQHSTSSHGPSPQRWKDGGGGRMAAVVEGPWRWWKDGGGGGRTVAVMEGWWWWKNGSGGGRTLWQLCCALCWGCVPGAPPPPPAPPPATHTGSGPRQLVQSPARASPDHTTLGTAALNTRLWPSGGCEAAKLTGAGTWAWDKSWHRPWSRNVPFPRGQEQGAQRLMVCNS